MITFKPVVYAHQRRKDGTFNIKVKVTFRRKARHLPTTLSCTSSDLTRSFHIRTPDILRRCNELIDRMRMAVADLTYFELEGRDVDFVVAHIRSVLARSEEFRLDFFVFADEKFLPLRKPQTALSYTTALGAFARYLGRRSVDVNDISRAMILDFVRWCDSEKELSYMRHGSPIKIKSRRRKGVASSKYVVLLGCIFRAARYQYNNEYDGEVRIPRQPFEGLGIKVAKADKAQKSLGIELMQRIISAEESSPAIRRALDAFVVSFALMGANHADLAAAAPPAGDTWIYNRAKTRDRRADRAEMKVTIPRQIRPYLARLGAGESSEQWLPRIGRIPANNEALHRWARREGLPPFTSYAARHSFATIARKAGVEKATVDECLAHVGDYQMADIYAERDWERINEANAKVIALFEWPESDK